MKFSAIWITKNEEANIIDSIASVKNAVDELIVVDTGSTDNTVEISRKAGAQVEFFEWCDDFSAARNCALGHATGEVVIFLDADEFFAKALTKDDRTFIEQMFEKNPELDTIQSFIFHLNSSDKLIHMARNMRILRKNPEFSYSGAVHERYLKNDGDSPQSCLLKNWHIYHRGYAETIIEFKHIRNIAILKKAVDNEKEPIRRSLYACYATRELSNIGKYDEALFYLKIVLAESKYLSIHFQALGDGFASCVYGMMYTAIANRNKVNRREIQQKIVRPLKQYIEQYPGTATIDLFFDVNFDLNEKRLLKNIDSSLMISDRKSENVSETSFLGTEEEICIKAAQAGLMRNDLRISMKYALEAKYRSVKPNLQVLHIILSSMIGISSDEAITFLNSCFDINNKGILRFLVDGTFKRAFKDVHVHYLNLYTTKFGGTLWDVLFQVLLTSGGEKAVQLSKKYSNNTNTESVAKIIMLASFLEDNKEMFYENKVMLSMYKDVLDAYFHKTPLNASMDRHYFVLMELYPLIAFIDGIEKADIFASLFSGFEKTIYFRRISYCAENGLFEYMLSSINHEMSDPVCDLMVLQAMIRVGRLEEAFVIINDNFANGKEVEKCLSYLAIICEKAVGKLKNEASILYNDYNSIYSKYIDLLDMLKTGYFDCDEDKKKVNRLKTLTYDKFKKEFLVDRQTPNLPGLFSVYHLAAVIFEEKSMPLISLECLTLAYRCNVNRKDVYEGMMRQFATIGNAALSGEMAKKIAAFNASVDKAKFEIIFLTNKASMWDSLESIWLAAKQDPRCTVRVIVVPYYDRLPDGSLGEAHYEGDLYPDYVQIENGQFYNITENKADIIVTHCPYDEHNRVTSIFSDYYCKNLKKPTNLLIYVPYYVVISQYDQTENLCINSGTLYSDYIFVQSEKIRDVYIKAFKRHEETNDYHYKFGIAEDKFIAAGSPKFDKVILSLNNDFEIPVLWKQVIENSTKRENRKIILYNTSIIGILNGKERHLKKLQSVLEFFSKNNDLVLWWRPHPLSEATYNSMLPELRNEYVRTVTQYIEDGFGIFDDTADLNRAIIMTDAYYGDYSSVIALYQLTGKPILQQNPFELAEGPYEQLEQKHFFHYETNENDLEAWINRYIIGNEPSVSLSVSKEQTEFNNGTSGKKIYEDIKDKLHRITKFCIE